MSSWWHEKAGTIIENQTFNQKKNYIYAQWTIVDNNSFYVYIHQSSLVIFPIINYSVMLECQMATMRGGGSILTRIMWSESKAEKSFTYFELNKQCAHYNPQ